MKHRLYQISLQLISLLLLAISCTKQDKPGSGFALTFEAKAVDAAFAGKSGPEEGVIQTTDSNLKAVYYTHLRAHETGRNLV